MSLFAFVSFHILSSFLYSSFNSRRVYSSVVFSSLITFYEFFIRSRESSDFLISSIKFCFSYLALSISFSLFNICLIKSSFLYWSSVNWSFC